MSAADHDVILVVEDEAEVRDTLREILEDEGYTVAEATNGQEALAWLRQHPSPCLVLLDLMMPVMSGYDLLRAMQAEPGLQGLNVLLLSAVTTEKLEETVRGSIAKGYFAKPIQLKPLLSAVERYC